ncbi:MAG TPA: class I SAM-dependent methyltransferase [Solirubrobacteraceae bacterium]|jgi:tRNA (cmo5U34)-methyltransferase
MTNATEVFNDHAATYNGPRRRLIPPFDAFYGTAVDAIALTGREPERILDLGAGTGMLSSFVRAAYPGTHLTLLDSATQMLAQAREGLGEDAATYVEADLVDPLPAGPFDAVVSALAIHHLDGADKRGLFERVHGALVPGGVFVNAEQVAGPGPAFDDLYARWHEERARAVGSDDAEWAGALERMRYDRCATVENQLGWLRAAGFVAADCLFKDHRFAVMVAIREDAVRHLTG